MMIFFQLTYPGDFQVCTAGKMERCITPFYIRPCKDDAIVIYPARQLEGTSFRAAAFRVQEIHTQREAMTPDVCVTPYPKEGSAVSVSASPEFLISARHPDEIISPN